MAYHHWHHDGGASSSAEYGAATSGIVGRFFVFPLIALFALVIVIYLQNWRFTIPATLAYFGLYHPNETLEVILAAPALIGQIVTRTIPNALGYTWDILCDIWDDSPLWFLGAAVALEVLTSKRHI